jgi:hypothetical protein
MAGGTRVIHDRWRRRWPMMGILGQNNRTTKEINYAEGIEEWRGETAAIRR